MDKKYQVFISSTYLDMKDERQTAVEAILDAGHIPAGMELFAASDKQQIEVIKGWIDKSDIFMLILGGRYGSVEPDSGKSYIQLEYEYAVEMKKPFFALYLTDNAIQEKAQGPLGLAAVEREDTKKLNEFRKLVKSKLCSEIEDKKDIKIQVPKAIRELSAANRLEGWVRASNVPDLSPLMNQLAALQAENMHLRTENTHIKMRLEDTIDRASNPGQNGSPVGSTADFSESALNVPLVLDYTVGARVGYANGSQLKWEGTYLQILANIGGRLLDEPTNDAVRIFLNRMLREQTKGSTGVKVAEGSFQSMKTKLVALGVVDLAKTGNGFCWRLTDNGKALLMKIHRDELTQ